MQKYAYIIVLALIASAVYFTSCERIPREMMDTIMPDAEQVEPPEEMVETPIETEPPETIEDPLSYVPRITVSDAIMQGKMTGPWLWMITPTQGGPDVINIDSLAVVSDGAVTEADIAIHGVSENDKVGDLTWTLGAIGFTAHTGHANNINDLVHRIGFVDGGDPATIEDDTDIDLYSSYALLSLVSTSDLFDVTMRVGSDDFIKVWLNGEVVYNNPIFRGLNLDYAFQDEFKVDLKTGDNLLLVKVYDGNGHWAMVVGIEAP